MGGDPTSREALQDLGQRLVEANAESFCRLVLESGGFVQGDNFVIDGVRHVEIFRTLERLSEPSTAYLLFLSADEGHRLVRVRDRADKDDFTRAATHRVEMELCVSLPALADAVIDATQSFDKVVSDCITRIEKWQQP